MKRFMLISSFLALAILLGACNTSPSEGQVTIHGFGADPEVLPAGGGTTRLSWDVEGATDLSIDPDVGPVSGESVTVDVVTTTTFTLTASAGNDVATETTIVEVEDDTVDAFDTVGLVTLTSGDDVEVVGEFLAFSEPVPGELADAPYASLLDSCEVFAESTTDLPAPPSPFDPSPGVDTRLIDAGDELVLTSGAGVYATVAKNEEVLGGETFIDYATDAPTPLPDDLVLDVPGADGGFPAFSSVPVPDADPFDLDASDPFDAVTPGTTYSWTPASPGGDTIVLLGAEQVFFDAETEDVEIVGFVCIVEDDGAFTLPVEAQDELAPDFSEGNLSTARRTTFLSRTSGSALLIVSTEVGDPDAKDTPLPVF